MKPNRNKRLMSIPQVECNTTTVLVYKDYKKEYNILQLKLSAPVM